MVVVRLEMCGYVWSQDVVVVRLEMCGYVWNQDVVVVRLEICGYGVESGCGCG